VKFPVCDEAILKTATKGATVVESVAVALPDPPPDTLTELICGDAAFTATFTVTVIAG
jgi:hypothetical protein